ncbi:bifunctional folylpolyglutamate synthase/dihydrofolate synthase [Salisediminibacterium beveridgei]|uniref:tetrahydrofolate synthase n=1 Tax=Salisediminibacterium beveridgei TaxID=632773 RepID=A0A1D7QTJ8_9BACI|nr:cyanophycin synthetase [Salisediminibacterium beveridgei]AOM82346.1 Dihydrofolate synthase / Folylpolyglutamate synthase [Salisediminibacterium beveridgei]
MKPMSMEDVTKHLTKRKQAGIVYDLTRIQTLLEAMGNPQDQIPCIHIAGTNGKGSTSAYTVAALVAQGLQVGAFNSPVFGDVHEHVTINGVPLARELFLAHAGAYEERVNDVEERLGQVVSEFEWLVGLACFIFDRVQPVDIVVLETGMGGRLDATNVVTQPVATAITNVGLDHQAYLGETLSAIAREKAGIMRPVVPCFTAATGEVFAVLKQEAMQQGAAIKQVAAIDTPWQLTMAGAHQQANASLAYELTKAAGDELGFTVSPGAFQQAVKSVQVPGRFETILEKPKVILDTGHNMEAIEAVIAELNRQQLKPAVLFAAMKDKRADEMLKQLEEVASHVTVTTFDHPRAMPLSALPDGYKQVTDVKKWLSDWLRNAHVHETLLITGSHQFIAEMREFFSG